MPSLIKSVAENSATSADEVVQREITEERKWDKRYILWFIIIYI